MTHALADDFAPEGVTVSLDETGDYPSLTVAYPAWLDLGADFVGECHQIAGEHGASIRFVRI